MSLRPLGHRILIKPDEAPTESLGGLILPDARDHVSVSGTVVAVGKGSQMLWEARRSAYRKALMLLDGAELRDPEEAARVAREANALLDVPEPTPSIAVGDRVAFPMEVGLRITQDGVEYLIMNEDDVAVLVEDEESAA